MPASSDTAPEFRPVFSSCVSELAYDGKRSVLIVRFNKGTEYEYEGVPADLAEQISNAPSVGEALTQWVKPSYAVRRVG